MSQKTQLVDPQSTAESKFGSVGKLEDGRTYVVFERRLSHSIETVWAAITNAEQLAGWFPGLRLEPRQGGTFDIWFGGECEGPAHVNGAVTIVDPPRTLQFGTMRFELAEDGAGCLLQFTDIVPFEGPRSDREIINSVLGGWHRFLDAFEEALAGDVVDHDKPELDYAKIEVRGRE